MPRAKRTAGPAPAAERLMNLSEAAEFLHIDPDTLRSLTRRGRVPAMKIGRQWRLDPALLREWIREQSLRGRAEPVRSQSRQKKRTR
jgi:excisionase family DNA binding protein